MIEQEFARQMMGKYGKKNILSLKIRPYGQGKLSEICIKTIGNITDKGIDTNPIGPIVLTEISPKLELNLSSPFGKYKITVEKVIE